MIFGNRCRRTRIFLSFLVIIHCAIIKGIEAARDRGARCEKPDYIPNGSYRIRRDRVMRITCRPKFVLYGSKTIDCVRGKWDGEKPVCAKGGCKKDLGQPENGRIQIEDDMKAILYCSDNYNLAGNRHSYCNGSHWDRPIGNCREHKNVVQHECDFETDDICGWTYEPREGLEWKQVMAANVFTTFKTGPRHDHTTLTANGGHYMLMESLTRHNDNVILTSPIYDRGLSLKTACCFQFYYFMYGAGVGDLFVVVKPVSIDLDDLLKNHKDLIKFQKYGNQNNIWNEAHFNIEELDEDFQILFVAKSGRGQLSDIAIDDVKLLTGNECRVLDSKDDEDLSNEEYDSTTYESIFEIQSCAGRCFESPGTGVIRTFGHLKGLCNCDLDCEDNKTCCPDFRAVCLNELFAKSTPISEGEEATKKIEAHKNYTTTAETTTIGITTKTTPTTTTTTTIKTTPTTTSTTITTTIKTTTTTITRPTSANTTTPRTTTTTIKPTPTRTKAPVTTKAPTTPKPLTVKTTKSTTMRSVTPTTTSYKTTPTTTTRKPTQATTKPTTTTTSTTRKLTTQAVPKILTTLKTTTSTKPTTTTTPTTTIAAKVTLDVDVPSTRRPIPKSKPIEYIITDKSKTETANKNSSSLLLFIFFVVIGIILAGAVYKRFGDRAVAWYTIRFKQNTGCDEESSSITTSFKRSQAKASSSNGNSRTSWRNKMKKSTKSKQTMKTPLVEDDDDDDDDDDIGVNGNIALKNNIYTEL